MKFEKWFYGGMTSGMIKDIDNITEDEMCSVKTGYVANWIGVILWSILGLFELLAYHRNEAVIMAAPLVLGIPCWFRVVRLNELRKPISDSRKMRIRKASVIVVAVLTIGCIVGTLLFNPSVAFKCVDIVLALLSLFYAICTFRHWKKVDEERKQ